MTLNKSYEGVTFDGQEAPKVFQDVVYAGHDDFGTAQEALDWANSNNYYTIKFPGGVFSEIQPYPNQHIIGSGFLATEFKTTTGTAINIQSSDNVLLENIHATCNSGGTGIGCGSGAFYPAITQFQVTGGGQGMDIDGNNVLISDGRVSCNEGDILLNSNSVNCVVDSLVGNVAVTNNGSSNVVGDLS